MNNLNSTNTTNQEELQVSTCNKCSKEIQKLSTQESIYQNNLMHTFNPIFEYCGQDDNIDMQTCEFTMCRKCLLSLFNSFQLKVKYENNPDWSVIE